MINKLGNVELFDLCETIPKVQCSHTVFFIGIKELSTALADSSVVTDFGQSNFGQSITCVCCVLLCVVVCVLLFVCWVLVWLLVLDPPVLHFRRTPPPLDHPTMDCPKFRSFFPLPLPLSHFLSGCLLVEFWWCFSRPGPSNVYVWALGLSCETPAAEPHTNNNTQTTTHKHK